jgi:predicted homoserine dehydrogenase-like protein
MLHQRLEQLERDGKPICVGIIGAGTFGTQIIAQTCRMTGMRIGAIAELDGERAIGALKLGGVARERVLLCDGASKINDAMRADRPAVTESAAALVASDVDVVVEATGNPHVAARHAHEAIAAGKHLVMVTVEADVVVGRVLKTLADEAGVMYSMAYGDEPALAAELVDWARTLGFRVVAAGKGTRFIPHFRKCNPDDVPTMYGFTGEDYNAQMFCSFLDGTKHAIEMTALANATGLVPDVRGMHFPAVDLRDMPDVLCSEGKGGILQTEGVVEAVSSMRADESVVERNVRGGLYCVVDDPGGFAMKSLDSYGEIIGMITGKRSGYAMIYRPQHWVGHEMPLTIARMMVFGQTCGAPISAAAEVVAAAKKPLKPGTLLDGEGGYTVYGVIERADVALAENLVPIGLTQGAEVAQKIPEDGMITYENVNLRESFLFELRRRQERRALTESPPIERY